MSREARIFAFSGAAPHSGHFSRLPQPEGVHMPPTTTSLRPLPSTLAPIPSHHALACRRAPWDHEKAPWQWRRFRMQVTVCRRHRLDMGTIFCVSWGPRGDAHRPCSLVRPFSAKHLPAQDGDHRCFLVPPGFWTVFARDLMGARPPGQASLPMCRAVRCKPLLCLRNTTGSPYDHATGLLQPG